MTSPYQVPNSNLNTYETRTCNACGKEMHASAATCPNCGLSQRSKRYKNKVTAAIFAFFLGGFGAHRFYLGQWWGVFYLLFCWLWIPGLIALVEFIYFLVCDPKKWDDKYNEGIPAGPNDKNSGFLVAIIIVIGLFMVTAIIGILAAVALPAYQDYITRAKINQTIVESQVLTTSIEQYFDKYDTLPASNTHLGYNKIYLIDESHEAVFNGEELIITFGSVISSVENETLILTPIIENNSIFWNCTKGTLRENYRPIKCRNR